MARIKAAFQFLFVFGGISFVLFVIAMAIENELLRGAVVLLMLLAVVVGFYGIVFSLLVGEDEELIYGAGTDGEGRPTSFTIIRKKRE